MDNLEKNIQSTFGKSNQFDTQKADAQRKEVAAMYDKKLKITRWITWGILLLETAIMIGVANAFIYSKNPKTLLMLGVVFLVAYNTTILIKLWYWIVNNKLNVLKEIKQAVGALSGRPVSAGILRA